MSGPKSVNVSRTLGEPLEPRLRDAAPDAVRGERPETALAEQPVDDAHALADLGVLVDDALELLAIARHRERPDGLRPQRVPRLRPDEVVADQLPVLAEVVDVADSEPHANGFGQGEIFGSTQRLTVSMPVITGASHGRRAQVRRMVSASRCCTQTSRTVFESGW